MDGRRTVFRNKELFCTWMLTRILAMNVPTSIEYETNFWECYMFTRTLGYNYHKHAEEGLTAV